MRTAASRFAPQTWLAPKKPKPAKKLFEPRAAFDRACQILAEPPRRPDTPRRDPVGDFIARWILPLDDAPTTNRMIEMGRLGTWALAAAKKRVRTRMLHQCGGRRPREPLSGRPHVRVIVFSHNVQDYDQGRTKFIVDRLQIGQRRKPKEMPDALWTRIKEAAPPVDLGWIAGDRRDQIDLATWSEACAPGEGCVLVELYTGEAT